MAVDKTPGEKDYDIALQAVANQMEQEGFEILGGSSAVDNSYSLVLQRMGKRMAVKVTTTRAPENPFYSPAQVAQLKDFAMRNEIEQCAVAPVGLMSAGISPDGEEGFYIKFNELVTV